jgi:hypothetical protein
MSLSLLITVALSLGPTSPETAPTMADAARLPPIDLIQAWQDQLSRNLGWSREYARQKRFPFLLRWVFACYYKELVQTWTMVSHMENARDHRVDPKLRLEGLRWLREHYPESWETRKWPVASILLRFRETDPTGRYPPAYIPPEARVGRVRADGESLGPLDRNQPVDD